MSKNRVDNPAKGLAIKGRLESRESDKNLSKSNSKSKYVNLSCNYCKEKKSSHKRLLESLIKKNNRKWEKPLKASFVQDKKENYDVYTFTDDNIRSDQGWILESACSFHICLHKE